jgi:hypothetical protein
MDEEKLMILVRGHVCLYNLQRNDYDNNLGKYNCLEIAGEELGSGRVVAGGWQGGGRVVAGWWHGGGMVVAGWWQDRGRGTVWERHGMCESAFKATAQRGMGVTCVN